MIIKNAIKNQSYKINFNMDLKKYLNNFKIVREKIKLVEERDHIRNFQPPVSGEEIMNYFNLKPCKEIGIIKDFIKELVKELAKGGVALRSTASMWHATTSAART